MVCVFGLFLDEITHLRSEPYKLGHDLVLVFKARIIRNRNAKGGQSLCEFLTFVIKEQFDDLFPLITMGNNCFVGNVMRHTS